MQEREVRTTKERDSIKCTVFAKGLRDLEMGEKVKYRIDKGEILNLDQAVKFVKEKILRGKASNRTRAEIRFEGKCWKCGKYGHVAYHCREGNQANQDMGDSREKDQGISRNNREGYNRYNNDIGYQRQKEKDGRLGMTGSCWNCGKVGHPSSKCWYSASKVDANSMKRARFENMEGVVRRMEDQEAECYQEN